jgi:hypothetical protein
MRSSYLSGVIRENIPVDCQGGGEYSDEFEKLYSWG